jgi:hypothetical protein
VLTALSAFREYFFTVATNLERSFQIPNHGLKNHCLIVQGKARAPGDFLFGNSFVDAISDDACYDLEMVGNGN